MPTPTSAQRGSLKKLQDREWTCTVTRRGRRTIHTFKAVLNHPKTVPGHEPPTVENGKNTNEPDDAHHPENHPPTADEAGWAKIDPESHTQLTSEGLRQWEMYAHVDHVSDLVPFWQRGVDAAAKGKVLRLEEFLEKMEGDGGWRTANEVLGMLGVWKAPPSEQGRDDAQQGWGEVDPNRWAASHREAWGTDNSVKTGGQGGDWGVAATPVASDETELSHREDNGWGVREAWAQGGTDFDIGRTNCSAPPPDDWRTRTRGKSVRAVRGGGRKKEERNFVDDIARQQAVDEKRRKEMHQFFEMSTEKKVEKIEETIQFLRTHSRA